MSRRTRYTALGYILFFAAAAVLLYITQPAECLNSNPTPRHCFD